MVLKAHRPNAVLPKLAAIALLLLALAAAGCVKAHDIVRLPQKTPIAVAYVMDDDHQGLVGEVPDSLKKEVAKVLGERNLEPFEIPFQSYAQVFVPVRDSKKRLLRLSNSEAPYSLLVETKAVYFAQLSGRYRWTVSLKLTVAAKEGAAEPMTASTELSTFMDFEHEKEAQTVASIAEDLARRAGTLLDEFLSAADSAEKKN